MTLSRNILSSLVGILCLKGCASVEPPPHPLPEVPEYLQVLHPETSDLSDLEIILRDPSRNTIPPNFAKTCDLAFRQLMNSTPSKFEQQEGLRELLQKNPTHYHWCFYETLQVLNEQLKTLPLQEEKQKALLHAYSFLGPLAQLFVQEYRDSRYLRFALTRYQEWSLWLFDKPLTLTPEGTASLVQPENPFGLWKKSRPEDSQNSRIAKYGLLDPSLPVLSGTESQPTPLLTPPSLNSPPTPPIPPPTPLEKPSLPPPL